MEFSKKEIEDALNEAYKDAGSNAYFGNGFQAGVEFVLSKINERKVERVQDEIVNFSQLITNKLSIISKAVSRMQAETLIDDDVSGGYQDEPFKSVYSEIYQAIDEIENEQKVMEQVHDSELHYTEKQANQKAAIAIRDFCKSVMHEDSDLHKNSTDWIKENLGIDICYKTNEPCKFDCKGICRESF